MPATAYARCVASLVLLHGPPASGKSTIATRLVDRRPLALNLDIDVVRGQLGRWIDDTTNAGLTARSLAIAMAGTHRDAAAMVERATTPDPVGEMFDRFTDFLDTRSGVHRIEAVRGDIEETLCRVETVLASAAGGRS